MSRRRPLVVKRSLDFHPAKDHARLAVLFRERILPATGTGPRTEQASRVRPDHFAGEQPHVEFMHGRLRGGIELTELAQQPRRCFSGDGDRLVTTALRDVVEIGDEPLVAGAWPDPDRVRVEAQLVAARDRRAELVELGFNRLVGAGDHADAFQLALRLVGAGDGRLAGAHLGLALEAEHWKRGAFGRGVEDGEFHRPGVAALIARVVAADFCLGARGLRRHRLAQREIRRAEIARHLHMRDVERFANFVEAMRLAVFGQRIAHLKPGRVQQIPQRVLVFVTIQPALRGAAFLRDAGLLLRHQG